MLRSLLPIPHNKPSIRRRWPLPVAANRSTVISHGAQVDINQHLALGNVTIIDFYADWCGPCQTALTEPRANGEERCRDCAAQNRYRELENGSCAAIQHSLDSAGERLRSKWPSRRHCTRRRFRKSEKLRRPSEIERLTGCAATHALARSHTNQQRVEY